METVRCLIHTPDFTDRLLSRIVLAGSFLLVLGTVSVGVQFGVMLGKVMLTAFLIALPLLLKGIAARYDVRGAMAAQRLLFEERLVQRGVVRLTVDPLTGKRNLAFIDHPPVRDTSPKGDNDVSHQDPVGPDVADIRDCRQPVKDMEMDVVED